MSFTHTAHAYESRNPGRQPESWRPTRLAARTPSAQGPARPALPAGTLTELYCQAAGISQLRLLVPLLATLSQQNKWITFVAPPCLPNATALAAAGVDTRKVQVIHAHTLRDYWDTLSRTLANGMSSAVLAWPEDCGFSDQRRRELEASAAMGRTVSVLFRCMDNVKMVPTADACTQSECGQLSLAL